MKNSGRGFSGLLNLSSNAESFLDSVSKSSSNKSLDLIELSKWPSMAAPWSSVDSGETWVWGDYFLTFQKGPKSMIEVLNEMQGEKPKPELQGMIYHYAITVFYKLGKNPFGPSHRPVLSVALEQANFNIAAKMMGLDPKQVQEDMGGSMGAVMIGMFTKELRQNLGNLEGEITPKTAREQLFIVVSRALGLSGQPKMIGSMSQAYGHPETGLPEKKKSSGCMAAMVFIGAGTLLFSSFISYISYT